jgi:eukaryotic-like serine/threonine-protein kinase
MDPRDITNVTLVPGGGIRGRSTTRGLPPGLVVSGRYEIGCLLGAGGMGLVYEARHLVLGTTIIVKVLRPELSESAWHLNRAANEARCLASVESDHVVRISDAGRLPSGLPFLVLERLRGTSLEKVIDACGCVPASIAIDYGLQLCRGLAAIHARGIVHRDIKPANLFLEARPELPSRVKILDFGIAGSFEPDEAEFESVGACLGSPAYAAPEQQQNWRTVDARADIWSVGVVLLELLVGKSPAHRGSSISAEARSNCRHGFADSNPDLHARLARVIERCTQSDRTSRYESIEDLAASLESLAQQPSPILRQLDPPPRGPSTILARSWGRRGFTTGGRRSRAPYCYPRLAH